MSPKISIQKADESHLDQLENLYNDLNDYLASTTNYPGWIKDIYPVRETALSALNDDNLFIALENGSIAGSIILNHEPEKAYDQAKWMIDSDYDKILVVRTLVVHPSFMKKNIATSLMEFTKEYAINQQIKAIRLDVSKTNSPAIKLYQKMGYEYRGTIDLGLPYKHLKWFEIYEMII